MKTVLFYAHRGGTGRSLCLVNCAAELAMRGKRVLALDLDLEAGGLKVILKGNIDEHGSFDEPRGLVSCLINSELESLGKAIETFKDYKQYAGAPKSGKLKYLPLYFSPRLLDMIQRKFNLPEEYSELLKALKKKIDADYDFEYMLVDLPTGVNQTKDVFLSMCEQVVMLSRPNLQGAQGIRMNMADFDDRPLSYTVVLSCVPNPSDSEVVKKIEYFKQMAGLPELKHIVPFDEEMAFSEYIPVITATTKDITHAYKKLVDDII